jgi:hypothetical protein
MTDSAGPPSILSSIELSQYGNDTVSSTCRRASSNLSNVEKISAALSYRMNRQTVSPLAAESIETKIDQP